jgi:predicted acyltransferase
VLHSFPWIGYDFSHLRIMGVLQRIAVAYLAASLIFLYTRATWQRALIAATILLAYWALQTMTPLPGGTISTLEPGRDLGAYIDRAVLGVDHLWKTSRTWDPEGLLSTLPAFATVLLGIMTGEWLRSSRTGARKTDWMLIAGVVCTLVGGVWGLFFPINKSLWTSSYVLFTGGIAAMLFAVCYWLIDVRNIQRWSKPFVIFGTNAIAAFFLSSLFSRILGMIKLGPDNVALKTIIYRDAFLSWATPINASLAFAIAYVLFWLGIMSILYHKRVFIKL